MIEINAEYHREWRKLHADSVRASSARFRIKNAVIRRERQRKLSLSLQRLARIKGCSYCGTHEAGRYHWHHPGEKHFHISDSPGRNRERIKAELALTIPLCISCHRKKHAAAAPRDENRRFIKC
jgi:hypothetical protein